MMRQDTTDRRCILAICAWSRALRASLPQPATAPVLVNSEAEPACSRPVADLCRFAQWQFRELEVEMIFDRLKGFWQRFFGADFAGGARPAIVSAEGGALSRRKLIMGIGIAGLCAAAGPSVLSSSAHAAEPEIDPDDLELAEAETEQEVAEASDELDEFSSQPRRRRRRRRPRGRRGPPRGRRRGPRRGSVAYRCRTSPAFRRRNRRTCRRVIGW